MENTSFRKHEFGKKRKPSASVDLWLVPYGDLITIMMIFFLLMWALTYLLKDKSLEYERNLYTIQKSMGGKVDAKEQELNTVAKVDALFKDKGLSKVAQLNVSASKIKIMLRSPILFGSGSAELNPGMYPLLDDITYVLKEMPGSVIIEGHTDNIPIAGGRYKSNFTLSAARAFAVVRYLLQSGVPPDRLSIIGFGDTKPLITNDSEEHRMLNRRIEISIMRQN